MLLTGHVCFSGDLQVLVQILHDFGRTCLLLLIIISMGGVFVLEQPALSWFECFPRFRAICALVKIWRASWYMLHYGAPTPKRHFAYSNSRCVLKLSRGKLRGWRKNVSAKRPVRHYQDKHGKKRYVGTKFLTSTGWASELPASRLLNQPASSQNSLQLMLLRCS